MKGGSAEGATRSARPMASSRRAGFGFDAGDQQHTAEMVERLAADDVSEQGFAEWLATRVIPIEKREAS